MAGVVLPAPGHWAVRCSGRGGSMLGLWGQTSFCGLLQSERRPSNLGLITVGDRALTTYHYRSRRVPMGRPLLKERLGLWVLALGTHSRLLLIATERWGACTVTPGREDPLRDGVGGGWGRGHTPTGPMWFYSGQALSSGWKGCEERAGGGSRPAGRGPTPSAWLIPGGWLSFAGTPTLSQPCPQATLLT